MKDRTKERLKGLFLLMIGLTFAAYNWYMALNFGYYKQLPLIGPLIAVGGLALLIISPYQSINVESHETNNQFTEVKAISNLWGILVGVGVLAFAVNWCLLAILVN